MDTGRRLGLLHEHDFRQLFVADTISQIGSEISLLALPLVAVLALHASNFAVGMLTAFSTLAFLLVGLPAGAWVDRMRRRRVLIVGDAVRALLLGSVPVAWALDVLSMPQLYLVALATGVCTVFFDVAYQSYLPHLVGRDHLVEGNAKLQAVSGVSQIAGPTIAGFAIQALTAPVAVALDAASFAGSALFVSRIRRREDTPSRTGAHLGPEIMEGLRLVLGNRLLRAIAMSTATFNLFSGIRNAMLIVLLARVLHLSAGTIGLFFSVASVGGLTGALIATRVSRRLGQGPTIWMSTAAAGLFALAVPAAEPGWPLWAAAISFAVAQAANVVYNVTQLSFRQGLTPEHLLGRMNATMRFLVWGTLPLGGLIGGTLGQLIGARSTLWVAAIGALIPFLPVLLSPLRTTHELPTWAADEETAEPKPPIADTTT